MERGFQETPAFRPPAARAAKGQVGEDKCPIDAIACFPPRGRFFRLAISSMAPLDEFLRQARRLRFADAALEARFQAERHAEGLLRSQATAVVALLYVAVSGWWQA